MTVTDAEWDAQYAKRAAAAKGDEGAWCDLFEWLWPWSMRLARSEDAAMGGWTRVIRNPSWWLRSQGYFAKMFKSSRLDEFRAERRHVERIARVVRAGGLGWQPPPSNAEVLVSIKESKEAIEKAVDSLEPEIASMVGLYLAGHTYDDVSKRASVPVSTVRRRIRGGLDTLRARINGTTNN
jgi:DNA-directed RNA polymerase specialized sigma24 family protein